MLPLDLYAGISLLAMLCYLFIFLVFHNVEQIRILSTFRLFLASCLLWTGGSFLMRIRFYPGVGLWYQVSLLGLFALFGTLLHLTFQLFVLPHPRLEALCSVGLAVVYGVNLRWGVFMPEPSVRVAGGRSYFSYHFSTPLWLLLAAVLLVYGYAVALILRRMRQQPQQRRAGSYYLFSVVLLLAGHLLTALFPSICFPFDMLGGLGMAVVLTVYFYHCYLYALPHRLVMSSVSLIVALLLLFSVLLHTRHAAYLLLECSPPSWQALLLSTVLLLLWSLALVLLGQHWFRRYRAHKQAQLLERIQDFHQAARSCPDQDSLLLQVGQVLQQTLAVDEVRIFLQQPPAEGETEPLFRLRLHLIHGQPVAPDPAAAPQPLTQALRDDPCTELLLDQEVQGFVQLTHPARMTPDGRELFRQICAYAAVCLKNVTLFQSIYRLSIHDELTGLYNRQYLTRFLQTQWDPNAQTAAVHLDIDDFRLINELYGIQLGDRVLAWCGRQISQSLPAGGAAFRYGSNEFLLLLPYRTQALLLEQIRSIEARVEQPQPQRPNTLQPIQFSVGVSLYPQLAANADTLVAQARRALFLAKQQGKHILHFYRESDSSGQQLRSGTEQRVTATVYALVAAIDAKDSYTFSHSVKVSQYAVQLAQKLALPQADIDLIREAGLLHDVGKIAIPEAILKKTSRLTEEEYAVMKTHVEHSVDIIRYLPNMSYVVPAVLCHHERYDGKGYPRGLQGEAIPLLGRCLAICDSFDAITSSRSYKPAMPLSFAREELLRNRGTQFDPHLTDAFVALIDAGAIHVTQPPSSAATLAETGELDP